MLDFPSLLPTKYKIPSLSSSYGGCFPRIRGYLLIIYQANNEFSFFLLIYQSNIHEKLEQTLGHTCRIALENMSHINMTASSLWHISRTQQNNHRCLARSSCGQNRQNGFSILQLTGNTMRFMNLFVNAHQRHNHF